MKARSVYQERRKVILIIGFTYILPVLLIFLGLLPFSWRFAVLILAAMVILSITRLYRFSAVELGFTQKHLGTSLKAISLPTLSIALLRLIHYILQGSRLDNSAYSWTFYLSFVGVSSPVQEFLYHGFLFSI
ncbi:MAG: CPBP family intramembrane metalloprotease, partial [Rhizonema sp. PD38]|nr:CPBP family intramembrane metalloprotease [Rhizonema sp. PD38]